MSERLSLREEALRSAMEGTTARLGGYSEKPTIEVELAEPTEMALTGVYGAFHELEVRIAEHPVLGPMLSDKELECSPGYNAVFFLFCATYLQGYCRALEHQRIPPKFDDSAMGVFSMSREGMRVEGTYQYVPEASGIVDPWERSQGAKKLLEETLRPVEVQEVAAS